MPFTRNFSRTQNFAKKLDEGDPLASFRDEFSIPARFDGPMIYLCGHSLGLMPRQARQLVTAELDRWAAHGVEGHFEGDAPWYSYHELVREPGARLVGARPDEVVFMNGLTANLHLMLASFYEPTRTRNRILIDGPTFPSDRYAVESHIRHRGYPPEECLVAVEPRPGEQVLREEDVEERIKKLDGELALVLLAGVNYLTGQLYDIPRIVEAAHRAGAVVGLDLAHAVGNVPLRLHDWSVDFAVWCSYKYLNSGPGAVGGCFVHQRHGADPRRSRLAGWWGNDPATRFLMRPEFVPKEGADGWQLSNPPILALAPVRAALDLFDRATMPALRAKSEKLTGYLIDLLETLPKTRCELITPRDKGRRGCQVSLRIPDRPKEVQRSLAMAGVVCDFREPDIIRAAPVPLYNTFGDVWAFVQALAAV